MKTHRGDGSISGDPVPVTLPEWLTQRLVNTHAGIPSMEERMRLVIEFSRLNVQHGTGGPFGAAIFRMDTWRMIAAGVNRVVPLNCSIAHAEMTAIMFAQKRIQNFDLGAEGLPPCELVTSAEPCAMCFGALPWSGIRQLVCGAASRDVERIGFDEGPKHPHWMDELQSCGIRVITGVCRREAARVLDDYHDVDGLVYNSRQG